MTQLGEHYLSLANVCVLESPNPHCCCSRLHCKRICKCWLIPVEMEGNSGVFLEICDLLLYNIAPLIIFSCNVFILIMDRVLPPFHETGILASSSLFAATLQMPCAFRFHQFSLTTSAPPVSMRRRQPPQIEAPLSTQHNCARIEQR